MVIWWRSQTCLQHSAKLVSHFKQEVFRKRKNLGMVHQQEVKLLLVWGQLGSFTNPFIEIFTSNN